MNINAHVIDALKEAALHIQDTTPAGLTDLRAQSFVAYLSGCVKKHDPALSDLLWSLVHPVQSELLSKDHA